MKRSFWIILCLLAVAGAWLLWPSGNRPSPVVKKTAIAARAANVALPLSPVNAMPKCIAVATNNVSAPTNRFAFRLANTAKTIGQLAADRHAILLDNALIETDVKMDLKIPAHLRAAGDPGAFIVQSRGVIGAAFRAALADAGGQIVSYIPNNAYLVQMDSAGAAVLSGNPLVQAVLPYEPYYKISASSVTVRRMMSAWSPVETNEVANVTLLGLAVAQKPLPPGIFLTLGLFGNGSAATILQIEKLGGEIVGQPDRSPFGPIVHVLPPENWIALAQLPGVQIVEPATRRNPANDLSRVTTGVAADAVTPTNYLNLTGSNVLVAVSDTGIDATHPDLTGRIFGVLTNDTDGHGTHVAGIIAGDGTNSITVTNAAGSIMPGTNGQFRGSAPLAALFSMSFGSSDSQLQEGAALTNALISNNSWNNGDAAYDLEAASYDAATRDAVPEITGPQPVLFVFSAGNNGGGDDTAGSGGNPDSIESPGTAKDVITVGALEQDRNITNVVTKITGSTTNTTQPWLGMTSTSYLVPGFSARGNVGIGTEGTFGRYKPDVTAPGTFVVSTRSRQWDTNAYYNPTNYATTTFTLQSVSPGALNPYSAFVPQNAVGVTIQVFTNLQSAPPFPTNVPVYVSLTNAPATNSGGYDILATNSVSIPPASRGAISGIQSLQGKIFHFAVGDNGSAVLNYNLRLTIATTNDLGNYYQQLQSLNDHLGTMPEYYRYETGTSMAAADVSGVLALMQDYFTNTLHTVPSPALFKAMLINGARPTGFYDFQVQNEINYQGWGLVNLPNSIPATLTNGVANTNNSVFFVDQSTNNALATGDSRTYSINLTSAASALPLRVTLAWTDPPGNPAAAVKLVNNLDLVVTNLDDPTDPLIFYGNDIAANNIYNTPNDTNAMPNFDTINNVENVFLPSGVGTNFTVTVIGRAVNVNAVTTQTNDAAGNYAPNIVQDFALVIASGDGSNTNGFTITPAVAASNPTNDQNITVVTSTNTPLMNQTVGASSPVMSINTLSFSAATSPYAANALLTIGQTNQWHFYIVTNIGGANFTNAAFVVFQPDTLAIPREGVFAGSDANSTRPEADIDLFVASGTNVNAFALTNLDPTVIANCINNSQVGASAAGEVFYGSSLGRGGSEFIVDTNSTNGQVYYIGVQSEDQMACEYDFLTEFSNIPFSQQNPNGDETVTFPQVDIPDGDATHPGSVDSFRVSLPQIQIRRVIATNILYQQNVGDLVVSLPDSAPPTVLLNHDSPNSPGIYTNIYDDSGQGDIIGSKPSDGPGSLNSFVDMTSPFLWRLHASDNAPGFIGNISGSLLVQKYQNLTDRGGVTNTVQPGSWFYTFVTVPVGYTNLTVFAVDENPNPTNYLTLAVKFGSNPTLTSFDESVLLTNTYPFSGGSFLSNSISIGPPLTPGVYFVGIFNPSTTTAHTVVLGATLAFSSSAVTTIDYDSTGPVPLRDDAVTYAYMDVTNTDAIQGINIGLRVDHPRISDLVFHLISPDGTRYLLMENRGGQSTNGCGATIITTNVFNASANGNGLPTTNVFNVGKTFGTIPITYNFYTVPDEMTVYYGQTATSGNQIFDITTNNPSLGGGAQNTQPETTNVYFPPSGFPSNSTYLTVVMNKGTNVNGANGTAWTYSIGTVATNFIYLSFTEDTNLTTTPIKFAPPPFVPQTNFTPVLTDRFEAYNSPHTYTTGQTFGGWVVATNQVEIVTNPPAFDGTNSLQLSNGVVSINVTTELGRKYNLTYEQGSNLSGNTNWQAQNYAFTASATNTTLVLASSQNALTGLVFTNAQALVFDTNTLIDDVALTELPANLYYQAEQDISGLTGNSAYGTMANGHPWQLEILDNRAGDNLNATLLGWQLEFTFANTNLFTSSVVISNVPGGIAQSNTVAAGAIVWYAITVPTNASFATNLLLSATSPVNVWFSTNNPPTITNPPADVDLIPNSTSGSALLSTNGSSVNVPYAPAYIVTNGTYYLGVQNSNDVAVTYAIEVNFDHGNAASSGLPPVVSKVKVSSNVVQFSWSVTSGVTYEVQWTTNLTAAWNTITNPTTATTNGVATFTDNGSQSAPLGPMRFYRLVQMH